MAKRVRSIKKVYILYTIVKYIIAMETTIQISRELLETLRKRKMSEKESYETIIWNLIEDETELSEEAKRDVMEAREQYKQGRFKTLGQIKKELHINV